MYNKTEHCIQPRHEEKSDMYNKKRETKVVPTYSKQYSAYSQDMRKKLRTGPMIGIKYTSMTCMAINNSKKMLNNSSAIRMLIALVNLPNHMGHNITQQ